MSDPANLPAAPTAHVPTLAPRAVASTALAEMMPKTLDDCFRLAKALSMSGDMIPKHFQGKPEATMAAVWKGLEVGLAPMQALASIAVINGRATIWGDAIPALVQRAGHHIDVEIVGTGDAAYAEATLTRGDTGRQVVRRFSMADAKRAQLLGKPGPWQQYPTRMLAHRARSWAVRDGAADALMGLGVADEMQDAGPDRARDVSPATPRKGGVAYLPPEVDDYIDMPSPDDLARAEAEALAEIRGAAE